MPKLAVLSVLMFATVTATAYPVEPWPLQNGPGGAAPQPTPAEIAAAQAAQQAQMAAYQQYLQEQQNLQQQQAAGTGNNELANSFGNMMPGGANGMGTQSVTTPNGNGLDVTGPSGTSSLGRPNYFINGCSTAEGRFQLKGVAEGADVKCSSPTSCSQKPSGCDKQVEINEGLVNFMTKHFNKCVQQALNAATKVTKPIQGGKIYNVGIMGDARHQAKGHSLHNVGLAMDVRAIEVGGRTYVYENNDPETRRFFDKMRQCWGAAVESERPNCLASRKDRMPQGTIGKENEDHKHHLHLSFPYCLQESRNLGLNIAWLRLLIPEASAADKPTESYQRMPEAATVTTKNIKTKNGTIKVTVRNAHGEPVAADHTIKLEVECGKKLKTPPAPIEIEACDYTDVKYDSKTDVVTVLYRTSDLVAGRVSCRLAKKRQFKVPCQ